MPDDIRMSDQLSERYREAFESLAPRFRFKDVHAALGGTSASNVAELLTQCASLGLVRKDGKEYVKPGDAEGSGGRS